MSYKSPLHIIEGIAFKDFEVSRSNLIRLRKQLLADLSLSGQSTLTIHKKAFSKDEIIKTIDLLLNDPDLSFHEFLYANKQLLTFLENEEYYNPFSEFQKLQIPDELKERVMQVMEERFMIQFKRTMSKRNFVYAQEALLFINHLPEEHRYVHYEAIHKTLISLANLIEETTTSIKLKKKTDAEVSLRFLTDMKFSVLLNSLPEDFNETINVVANRIINFMYHYHKQKKYDRVFVKQISYMLMKVRECDENQSAIIRNNHKVYSGASSASGSSNGSNAVRIIYFVIFIIVTFLRTCQ
jgi:hypothetical protein